MVVSTPKRPKMTAYEARYFEGGQSLKAIVAVAEALAERNEADEAFDECECEAYTDVFTFNRWLAQGMAVQRGQRAIRHLAWIPMSGGQTAEAESDGDTPIDGEQATRRRLRQKITYLFCRCQVAHVLPKAGK